MHCVLSAAGLLGVTTKHLCFQTEGQAPTGRCLASRRGAWKQRTMNQPYPWLTSLSFFAPQPCFFKPLL